MKNSWKNQQGYLTLITVVLIVIIGFIAATLAYIIYGSAFGSLNLQQATQALYLAESGLEDATHTLLANTLAQRGTCTGLSLTNNSIGNGAYSVTSTGPFYVSSPTTLTSAIASNAISIAVASTANYQTSGRIMIDQEIMNYAGKDATHFLFVQRGMDNTLASSHASTTPVGQYQCQLTSTGGLPGLTFTSGAAGGKRILKEAIQLQEGWVAGSKLTGPAWNVAHWNTPTEKQWTQQTIAIASPQNLTAVSIVSNVDAWVVGDKASALRFNGSSWSLINTGLPGGDNLTSVSAISSQEVWSCSDQGKIYKWTPSTNWTTSASPGNKPNGISMIDTNGNGTADAGWLVATKKTAFRYNGATWASANTGITVDLNGVSTLSATDAWAVGPAAIFQWNGSTWSSSSPTAATLNSISMIKSGNLDVGWTVGTSSTALYFDGTSWTLKNTGLAGSLTLNSVKTVSPTEAWTVTSTGVIYEWNGSTWTQVTTLAAGLNGIDILHPNKQPFSAWSESF